MQTRSLADDNLFSGLRVNNESFLAVKTVFFTVDTPVDHHSKTGKLSFTNVVTNEGDGYNVTSGNFTVSIPGIYHVSLTVDANSQTTPSSQHDQCAIKKNGSDVLTLNTHAGTVSSSSAYVKTVAGDVLTVYCDGGVKYIDSGSSTVFSGALVMKM